MGRYFTFMDRKTHIKMSLLPNLVYQDQNQNLSKLLHVYQNLMLKFIERNKIRQHNIEKKDQNQESDLL